MKIEYVLGIVIIGLVGGGLLILFSAPSSSSVNATRTILTDEQSAGTIDRTQSQNTPTTPTSTASLITQIVATNTPSRPATSMSLPTEQTSSVTETQSPPPPVLEPIITTIDTSARAPKDTVHVTEVKRYIEIKDPSGFVNTDDKPIRISDYVGKKVILLNVMTFSCINCQRTFPYVNSWYDTYKDEGLIVIGIHTPEFAYEKNKANVEEAMMKFGITYPVVLDNDYKTWRAYGNRYWPRKYLIDIHGNIVYDHIGEGAYKETEAKIQELLKERTEVLNAEQGT